MNVFKEQHREALINRVIATKKTNTSTKEVEAIMNKIFAYIDFINAQREEEVDKIFNKEASSVCIINEFKDFILPKSVRLHAGNMLCKDLLIREEKNEKFQPSYDDFYNVQAQYRGLFKKESDSDVTPISNLRLDFSVNDIEARMALELTIGDERIISCHYVGEPYIPLFISTVDQFYKTSYFNATSDDVVGDYISSFR